MILLAFRWTTCPDLQGIETHQTKPRQFSHRTRWTTCPDLQGIETLYRVKRLPSPLVFWLDDLPRFTGD